MASTGAASSTGRFEATLQVTESAATGNYGIYTYPASGAVNAAYELGTPLALTAS